MKAIEVWQGSNGADTIAFYNELAGLGPAGEVARELFRANKASARAKVYRGGIRGKGSYKSMAYDKKNWSLGLLSEILTKHASGLGIAWGWKVDPTQEYHRWVLYVDLPEFGQVSYHSAQRLQGPDYPGDWDRTHLSAERIIQFCDRLLAKREIGVPA